MKMRNVLASVAACAIAVSAMSVAASAKVLNAAEGDDKYCMDITAPNGKTFGDIYGFEVTISGTPAEGQSNVGAVCWQSTSTKWTQKEFSLTEGEKDIDIKDNKITYVSDAALFKDSDEFAQVFVAQWTWDGANQADFTVEGVKLLDKDGKELGAAEEKTEDSKADEKTDAPETDSKAEESKADEKQEETKKDDTKTTGTQPSSKTGDAGVGAAVAGLALAGAAAVVARKRK